MLSERGPITFMPFIRGSDIGELRRPLVTCSKTNDGERTEVYRTASGTVASGPDSHEVTALSERGPITFMPFIRGS